MVLPPFQTLIDSHAHDIHRFLVSRVGALDADDCYQETWVAALGAYPRLRSDANLRGWLFTIAHHKAIDTLRARARAPLAVGAEPPDHAETAGAGDPSGPARSSGGVPDLTAEPELWGAVAALPPKQRTAVALRFVLDADYSRIAVLMGTSTDAARANVHAGLRRLGRVVDDGR
ncbi:RNA polymerase sigma factor [Conexibacter sp. DBS9H8]|uniref:RNA polymerase sigma factor n=1 Tax=Conexibacter sp. DBS9H8 TaxID=2937801 RepID=UPI00200C6E9F|nr:RNA polymerase sigma factor [Conexibacter sp. DBS9H8]